MVFASGAQTSFTDRIYGQIADAACTRGPSIVERALYFQNGGQGRRWEDGEEGKMDILKRSLSPVY